MAQMVVGGSVLRSGADTETDPERLAMIVESSFRLAVYVEDATGTELVEAEHGFFLPPSAERFS